jgi:hypothetical protein
LRRSQKLSPTDPMMGSMMGSMIGSMILIPYTGICLDFDAFG